MANLPEQYTQEAQDKRDRDKKLTGPKSRHGWGSECMKFDCVNRDKKCRDCWRYDNYVSA